MGFPAFEASQETDTQILIAPLEVLFLRLYTWLPYRFRQWALRTGWARGLVNVGSYAGLLLKILILNWKILFEFVMSKSEAEYGRRYGVHPMQTLDIFPNQNSGEVQKQRCTPVPTLVFVHGGAWGSGTPHMYRLLGAAMAKAGFNCIVVGYRTYPCASVQGQISDVKLAIQYIYSNAGKVKGIRKDSPIYLCGHSSGAHISSMLILEEASKLDFIHGFVGLSGAYDLRNLYEWHKKMGIHQVGPMCPANGGLENFDDNSPLKLAEQYLGQDKRINTKFLLLHSRADVIVPYHASEKMYEAIGKNIDCTLCIIERIGHLDILVEMMDQRNNPIQVQLIKQFCGLQRKDI
mmetsp:Transcript_31047/g.75714  ORF Transcript_31047/g.75714 Transcript_31047/m.75714 type:complete len:349 (-) Transcript_31047:134-1180(-)